MFGGASYLSSITENRPQTGMRYILIASLLRSYVWGILSPLMYYIAKRLPIVSQEHRLRNISVNFVFGILVSLIYALLLVSFAWTTGQEASQPAPINIFFQRLFISLLYTVLSLYIPTFVTIVALLVFRDYRDEEAKNASLRAELSNAQLNALKMQLHPHFLFNSLHSISSLILIDPRRANEMVALLGDFLRQTLEHSNDQIVPLSEDLEFLKTYLEIEKTRFEDRLSVDFSIPAETLNAQVPHLIVQPILENAIKHGIAPFADSGTISIASERVGGRLILSVENSRCISTGVGRSKAKDGNGIGIANVRTRLDNLYGEHGQLTIYDENGNRFRAEIAIPFLLGGDEREEAKEHE